MTIKTFKKLFNNLIVVTGGKKVEVELIRNGVLEPIARYNDIINFMVDETFDNLKIETKIGAFLFINSHRLDISVK